jgi:hypothetical protein
MVPGAAPLTPPPSPPVFQHGGHGGEQAVLAVQLDADQPQAGVGEGWRHCQDSFALSQILPRQVSQVTDMRSLVTVGAAALVTLIPQAVCVQQDGA